MRKIHLKGILSIAMVLLTILPSCKKTYVCKGTDGAGEHSFICENCREKQQKEYEQEIIDKGYSKVSCIRD